MTSSIRHPEIKELHSDWEIITLKERVSDFIVPMRDKPKRFSGNIPWCRIEDFDGIYLSTSKSGQFVDEETIATMRLKVYPVGTVLVSCSANLGFCAITAQPLVTNQTFIGLVPSEKLSNLFLYYVMSFNSERLNLLSNGTTIVYLSREQFEKFRIAAPKRIEEQCKIAEILSTVDETIEKTDAIIQKTQQLKKGLMQKLFTEGIGHSRFKETKIGQIPEEWEVVRLAKVSEIRFSNVDKKSYPGEIPVHLCNYQDVYNNEYIDEKIDFMEATAATAEIEKFSLNKGDVIITKDSETADDIAVPSVVIEELNNVLCGYHLALLQPNAKKVDSIFLSKLLSSIPINNQFVRLAQGLTRFGLNVSHIQNAIIPLPSLDEQHQIAQILSEVNLKTEGEQAFKEELEQLKKGLMQVLLTGKARVKV